jgi:hypothetical protein
MTPRLGEIGRGGHTNFGVINLATAENTFYFTHILATAEDCLDFPLHPSYNPIVVMIQLLLRYHCSRGVSAFLTEEVTGKAIGLDSTSYMSSSA